MFKTRNIDWERGKRKDKEWVKDRRREREYRGREIQIEHRSRIERESFLFNTIGKVLPL